MEGFFGRVFRSGLQPVELGRKLVREMDLRRSVGVRGRAVSPNVFTITLSSADHAQLADVVNQLRADLVAAVREHARDEHLGFAGTVDVAIDVDESLRAGEFHVEAGFREDDGGTLGAALVLPDGTRVRLGDRVVTLGRQTDATIVFGDPNVSRRHAEIRPVDGEFELYDTGSTNGCVVNGERVAVHRLEGGDVIVLGSTRIVFELS